MEQKRPVNSAVIEARCDVRILARVSEVLVGEGIRFESKSEFVRRIIQVLYDVFRQNQLCEPYDSLSTDEALAILYRFGIERPNRGGRNVATLQKQVFYERQSQMLNEEQKQECELPEDIDPEWWTFNIALIERGEQPITFEEWERSRNA